MPKHSPKRRELEPFGYRIHDAVEVSGVSRTSLYELMAAGELDYVKIKSRRIIPHGGPKGLAALLERHRQSAA